MVRSASGPLTDDEAVAPHRRARAWRRGVAAVVALGGLAALGGTVGWAASLATGPGFLASGTVATASCDPAPAWTWTFGADAHGRVASVTVAGVAAACAGGGIVVSAGDGTGTPSTGSAALVCATTCSATVPLTGTLRTPSQITVVHGVVSAP